MLALSATALALTTAACTQDPAPKPEPEPTPSTAAPESPREVTFGAYGTEDEVNAMRSVVDSFNASSTTRRVELVTWPTHEVALREILAGEAPDVFLTSRIDLQRLVAEDALQPVSLLLDERGVDFGDRYARGAVDAFAYADELQCMAYSVSPMVIYYNNAIVDFEQMDIRGLDVPSRAERWNFEEFAAAAQFASTHPGVRGVWIEPTLEGLAPFILSGGGQVFDDTDSPTSLSFSDDGSREALSRTLEVLRDPTLTPTPRQMRRSSPVELFKAGRLGIMAGHRNLVPELRATPGLSFDVMTMPNIDGLATVGDVSGLCISADSEVIGDAADFIAYAVSDAAVDTVTRTGYIVPANTHVAASETFRNEYQDPVHAGAFTSSIRYMSVPPFIDDRDALLERITPLLERLVTRPGVLDLEAAVEEIDAASREVLAPEEDQEEDSE